MEGPDADRFDGERALPSALVEACCAALYGDPLVELFVGQSLHPGGLALSRRLLSAAGLTPGQRFLDAGCGLGATARLAATEFGLSVDACDVSGAAIRRARQLTVDAGADVRFAEGSVLELPYPDGSFDAVITECVLSTTSRAAALLELRRVMAPGGRLLVSDVTAAESLDAPEPLASVLCLTGAWGPGEFETELMAAGFIVDRSWDEADGIAALIDRLEARANLLATVLRDASGTANGLGELRTQLARLAGRTSLSAAFGEARRLLDEQRIGYTALVARTTAGPAGVPTREVA